MVFANGFLFLVKELGLFINLVIGLGFWMLLALISILYCEQCITMNEYKICWFSRFGFCRFSEVL
jgi:hypothetical protein